MKRSLVIFALVVSASLMAAAADPPKQVEWLYYGGDQGGMKFSPLTDINARQRAAAADRLAVEALGDAAAGIRHDAGLLREHAADDRRRAVRDDAVQQHRGARRRDRQGAVAVRRRSVQARAGAVRQRLEAARHRVLARRRQAAHLPQQPRTGCSSLDAQDRQAGADLRQERLGVADRRPDARVGLHARHAELAADRSTRIWSSWAARFPTACRRPIRSARCRRSTRAPASASGSSR